MDEDKRGTYTSAVLASVLVSLSLVLLGVAGTGGIVGAVADNSEELAGEVSVGNSDGPAAEPPSGLAFLCDDSVYSPASGTQLGVEQKNEAEEAAERYVMAAYGFEGSDAAAHEQGVEEQVVGDCFWNSEPGGDTENMNEAVRSGAPRSASSNEITESPYFARAFVLFDVDYSESVTHDASGAEYLRTRGTAVWLTEDSEGMYPREQTLTLVKKKGEGRWKVLGGNAMPPNSTGYDQQAEEKIEEIEYGEPAGGGETTAPETTSSQLPRRLGGATRGNLAALQKAL